MSNGFDNLDVIIIGGGLAGLTTAALLARSGKAVTRYLNIHLEKLEVVQGLQK